MVPYRSHTMVKLEPRWKPETDNAYCYESNAPEILGVTGAFCGAALITVILRLYVRTSMLRFVGADDYAMIGATLMAIGTFICFVCETKYGIGRHTSCVTLKDEEVVLKWQFFHSLLVMFGVVLVKISIAFFLMRLAPKASWRRCLSGAIGESKDLWLAVLELPLRLPVQWCQFDAGLMKPLMTIKPSQPRLVSLSSAQLPWLTFTSIPRLFCTLVRRHAHLQLHACFRSVERCAERSTWY